MFPRLEIFSQYNYALIHVEHPQVRKDVPFGEEHMEQVGVEDTTCGGHDWRLFLLLRTGDRQLTLPFLRPYCHHLEEILFV